ncbi:hypothetical protein [Haloarchaeobius iranensis]|uniref:Uncharacterized protein n=1 Tax=Haloarchaeobius iranensis TaxID=996166 RepID=A0A1G9YPR4_9EURY|nr:hypothetical protein [Haloarchaeobius iranensis]SDN11199.1 hypothetical protein SAMN05192554_11585 [Haloarchaeobius iranensis]
MADTKKGRDKKALKEERRQEERVMEAELEAVEESDRENTDEWEGLIGEGNPDDE